RLHHEYVGTEHILLGLVREGEGIASAVLTNLNVDLEGLRAAIQGMLKEGKNDARSPDLPYTSRAKKILEFSMSEARELDHAYVGTEHLLLGVLREEKGIGAQALRDVGVTLETARAEVLRLLGTVDPSTNAHLRAPAHVDQRFKAVIALVELHRLRFGAYPDSLKDLQFLAPYDQASLQSVRYEKLPDGYALDIITPRGEKPGPSYPADFWRGLGIRRTNVDRSSP
ncbi:MAG TPA: Clp protease N-terminal domain-containing protein, partial [Gemmatimonadales bacterium]|nr:Clp protease N-terminal domain-containing protein [Gemmatimonadales bacterium]